MLHDLTLDESVEPEQFYETKEDNCDFAFEYLEKSQRLLIITSDKIKVLNLSEGKEIQCLITNEQLKLDSIYNDNHFETQLIDDD